MVLDERMTDAEGLMWRLEKDPHLSSSFCLVSLLDRSPDVEALRQRMDDAKWSFARLRQRVQPAPVNLQAPAWVDDPEFDINYHVRHVNVAEPGTLRQLLNLAAQISLDPMERTRPLWQFTVVDGLKGGRAALIVKMHHTMSDGENGIRMSLEFTDFERNPPPRPPVERPPDANGSVADATGADETGSSNDPAGGHAANCFTQPRGADVMRDLVAGGMRLPLGVWRQTRELLADPAQIPEASHAALDTLRGVVTQLSEVDRARSPLWTERSLTRRAESLHTPLGPTRDAAKKLGGTLNTAFLTAAAEAAGDYHRELGAPVDELRASMVISTRTETSGANAFTLARMLVPTAEMDIAERFIQIRDAADAARRGSANASLEKLAVITTALPTSLITRLARQQAQTIDFATSNLRGSPVPLYIAGAKVLHNYPMGPLSGVAFNLTLMSYMNSLDMGVNIDAGAVEHPTRLRTCLKQAFRKLARV